MDDNYDDDTHYCLKCHSTIIGLDNYVNHRKLVCTKTPSKLLSNEAPISLKADDFFSSLELQSSSKKLTRSTNNVKSSGRVTRSKTLAVLHGNASSSKELLPLQQQKCDESWIGDGQYKETDNAESKTSKKDLAREADYEDSEQESIEYVYDEESEEDDDEEEDRNAPPKTYTGGKWKPNSPVQWYGLQTTTDDREWSITPPPTYTGGKWKPTHSFSPVNVNSKRKSPSPTCKDGFSTPSSFSGGKWSSKTLYQQQSNCFSVPPSTYTKGKWKPSLRKDSPTSECSTKQWEDIIPPPNHTKGKWKPSLLIKPNVPPPSHTRGKWKPRDKDEIEKGTTTTVSKKIEGRPFRKSNGRIQYWCGSCNRRLSSKIVYNRHLKSELHLKRTNDGDFDGTSHFKENRRISGKGKDMRLLKSSVNLNEQFPPVKRRNRKKLFKKCDVCKTRVNMRRIGKHLISHYHCRRGNLSTPESQKMILDNIHNIVLQSPFQCAPCKFYCNTHELFLKHWISPHHSNKTYPTNGYFNCSFCNFNCVKSEEMYQHLISQEHSEVISVINRSVPIIIKRLSPLSCATCGEEFLLNIQLRKHCEKENHPFNDTSSDSYQSKHKCDSCDGVFKSAVALQRHAFSVHKKSTFICGTCTKTFDSIDEAKKHRRTAEHRYKVLERRRNLETKNKLARNCSYCSKRFENILELKKHQQEDHPEIKHSCPYCGKCFTISQELTVHIRTKACSFTDMEDKEHSCKECPFKTDSMSDFLFHNVLHTEPLVLYSEEELSQQTLKKPLEQYKCPVCEKFYPKSSLRCHIRLHTSERPYTCKICQAGFTRKNNLIYHMKRHDKKEIATNTQKNKTGNLEARLHLCSTCGASFRKRSILQQHMTRHTGKLYKCPRDDCVFSARTPGELKPHLLTHAEDKPFSCQQCDYRGKTKQQLIRHLTMHDSYKKYHCSQCSFSTRFASHLRRHLRLHTGAKPFACPHCDYRCNNLENLRKHVLSTLKHPGKCIYECKFCEDENFQTNFAKDYKIHLVNEHSDKFVSGREAATYVAGIYEAGNDTPATQSILNANKGQSFVNKENLQKPEEISNLPDPATTTANITGGNLGPAILLTSVSVQDASDHKVQDDLFPMFIVSRDVVRVENMSETWNMEGNYDVEEAGVLIPFQSEGESLFNEHF